MSYRPKKYVYIAVGGYHRRFTIGVYATKLAAELSVEQWARESEVEAWVERHTIAQDANKKHEVKKYLND